MTVDELARLGYTKVRLPEWGPLQYLVVFLSTFSGLSFGAGGFLTDRAVLANLVEQLGRDDWLPVGEPESKSC